MFPSVKESLGSFSDLFTTRELEHMESKAVAISSIPSSPPEILLSFQTTDSLLFVVNHSLLPLHDGYATAKANVMSLSTVVRPGHRALLDAGSKTHKVTYSGSMLNMSRVWCTGGQASQDVLLFFSCVLNYFTNCLASTSQQGWSLVGTHGTKGKSYFICWDGAVDDNKGPFIFPFHTPVLSESDVICLNSAVMPLMSYVKHAEKLTGGIRPSTVKPATTPAFHHQQDIEFSSGFAPDSSITATMNESIRFAADMEGGLDCIIIHALESISDQCHHIPEGSAKLLVGSRTNRSKNLKMSHQEKSNRLLRECSSWTVLEEPKENRGRAHGQSE
jgi:hypothetical protein